jgi:predicted NAD/FAD-dependent oxidoreductase
MSPVQDVVVVGAGLAGLAAARELERRGRRVTVIDKGRSVGGRLATRRVDGARLDHGAQFFTQRGPEMAALVAELSEAGLVRVWCRGFTEPDGHPRHVVVGGMNALAKHLASGLQDVRTGVPATAVRHTRSGWVVDTAAGQVTAAAALLTAPVPQSLALLDAGGTRLDAGIRPVLDEIAYDSAMAVLVVLDRPAAVPAPGAVQLAHGPFSFVADNRVKGISEVTALTLHTTDAWSRPRWDLDDDTVLAEALAAAAPWLGDAEVVDAQVKRWRYASPRRGWPEPCCVAVDGDEPQVLAGDAFDGPRVEGAYRSGLAAATAVLRAHLAASA